MKKVIVCEARTGRKFIGKPRYIARWQYGRAKGHEVGHTRGEAMTRAISAMREINDAVRTADITKYMARQPVTADRS